MRLLFISTFLDSAIHQNRAPYNEQLLARLADDMTIDVIRPVSWLDCLGFWFKKNKTKKSVVRKHTINSSYPILFYLPLIGASINGYLYCLSIMFHSFKKVRKADILYASWLYPDGYAVMLLAKWFKKPYVVQALGSDINELLFNSATQKRILSVANNASVVSVVSHDLKTKLIEQGIDKDKIKVIYTGIETSKFYPVAKFIAEQKLNIPGKKRILYIGNLKQAKGINDLLTAVSSLFEVRQDFELCIAGSGPEQQLVHQYQKQNPDMIKPLGVVDHGQLHWWINASTCVCLPSYSEGVPNVLLEAMICETNIVATHVGGIPEVVANPDTFLIDAGDVSGLIAMLDKMLDEKDFVTWPKLTIPSYKQMADSVKDKLLRMSKVN